MVLQQISLLSSLSRCPLLARKYLTSQIFCTRWRQTAATVPYARTVLRNEQKKNSCHKFLQRRNFFSFFKKNKSPEKFREDDNILSHYELVYSAVSISYVKLAFGGVQTVAGTVCLTLGAIACGFPLVNNVVLTEDPLQVGTFITLNSMLCLGIYKFCTVYPLRIYYSEVEDNFILVFVGTHPLAVRHLKVPPGGVKPKPPGKIIAAILPWSELLYSTPTQTVYLNDHHFRYPVYYNKLLGYV